MSTHSYATLKVSRETFDEIATRLVAVGYNHAIRTEMSCPHHTMIDMHGIALICDQPVLPDIDTKKHREGFPR